MKSLHIELRFGELHFPVGTQRNDNVIITSKRRRFDVIMTLLLRRVPAGFTGTDIKWTPLWTPQGRVSSLNKSNPKP